MGKTTRRKHTAEFKAKVAMEALREQSTLSELSSKYELSQAQISRWKAEFIKNAAAFVMVNCAVAEPAGVEDYVAHRSVV